MDKEEIQVNSEDEDYSDLPPCGSTGDPSYKVKPEGTLSKEKTCMECACDDKKEEEKETKVEELKKERKTCYKCKAE